MKSIIATMTKCHSIYPLLMATMVLFMALAGCMSSNSSPDFDTRDWDEDGNQRGGGNGTQIEYEDDSVESQSESEQDPQWPPLESAPIRPGARLPTCTTNFVYWDPINDTVYMGTAAHCVDNLRIGDNITIVEGEFPMACVYTPMCSDGASIQGIVAYSGWWTGSNHDKNHGEDFALIEISEEGRNKVHPKVLHYGGPTALASRSDVGVFDRVLWYGHSSGRQSYDPIQPNEGYICGLGSQTDDRWKFTGGGPVMNGDSGSPVLIAKNGMALGVLTTLFPIGCGAPAGGGAWIYVALEEANSRGMNVQLATWPLVEDGDLPDLPV